jgi:hypothetical protein
LLDGFVALVEEIEHLAGVELGAAAEPVGAGGLSGGEEVVLCGFGDLVLAALGIGESPVGHVEAGIDEVAGLFGVGDDLLVEGDGGGAVAGVFGEVGDFEAEEIVVGILVGETFLDGDGFGVAAVVAQEEGEGGAGLDGSDDAVGGGFAKEVEAFFFVATYAGDADHHANEARKAGNGELLDANGHFGVGVVGVDADGLFAVVAGGEALAGGSDVTVFGEGDEGGMHAAGVTAGEVGVGVVGIGFDLLVGEGDGGVGERFDAVACVLGDVDGAFVGEEGVVRVVGGVEEILIVEFAEDECLEDVGGGDDALRMGFLDSFEAGEGSVVVEVVEAVVGFADLGGEVDGIGVGGGVVGLEVGWSCDGGSDEDNEQEGEDSYAAFYGSSPMPIENFMLDGTIELLTK